MSNFLNVSDMNGAFPVASSDDFWKCKITVTDVIFYGYGRKKI
jgi:hypothetical protein